ncbi:MAG: type II secretion system protein [Phycisphaeraceae bacterium]
MLFKRGRAFTIVEMLLVISLITLLISMLMPALGKSRRAARAMLCSSQAAQLTWAVQQFVDQNQGKMFPFIHLPKMYWIGRVLPYLNDDDRILICPETTGNSGGLGNAHLNWGPIGGWGDNKAGSYGMNLWLLSVGDYSNDPNMIQAGYHRNLDHTPSDTPVFGDSQWVGAWPDDIDTWPTNTITPPNSHLRGFFMSRFCIDRHDEAINVSFRDGSARRVRLRDLWQLKWHRTFIPGDPK